MYFFRHVVNEILTVIIYYSLHAVIVFGILNARYLYVIRAKVTEGRTAF
jgi:hypothetical protein